MTAFIVLICFLLLLLVLLQVGRITELTAQIKGEYAVLRDSSKWNGFLMLFSMVVFLGGTIWSAWYYKDVMLGYGPLKSASAHGGEIDSLFNITLFFTGIVFVLTHIALFYFAFKYRWKKDAKAQFVSHNNKLEVIWTAIPALVMAVLVIRGLNTWNAVMADVKEGEDYIEFEATGQQFNWIIRYPGADNKLGTRNYKLTTGTNPVGQDWADAKNWDDFHPDEIYLPVGKKVRVRIVAKDVLHNFYLPHFRVKMDAVPGLPTYFVFTPTKTTAEYRSELKKYPDFNLPYDPKDPEGGKRWEKFDFELACAELCGKGHYSMRRVVKIVSQAEYDAWLKAQKSFYVSNIRGTKDDPNAGQSLEAAAKEFGAKVGSSIDNAMKATAESEKTIRLDYINFETGSAKLTDDSHFVLDAVADAMKERSALTVELAGHTDNVGDAVKNLSLSKERAEAVANYLVSKGVLKEHLKAVGYGDTKPAVPNDSDENKAKNRRTELKIVGGAPAGASH